MEIHQQAHAKTAHAEMGEDLECMGRQDGGDGLDFQDDGVGDDDVSSEAHLDRGGFVDDGDHDLALEVDAGLARFPTQAFRVDGVQQARWSLLQASSEYAWGNGFRISFFRNF